MRLGFRYVSNVQNTNEDSATIILHKLEAHVLTAICLSSSGCTVLNRSGRSTASRTSSFSWKELRRMEVKRSGRWGSGRESRRRCLEGGRVSHVYSMKC